MIVKLIITSQKSSYKKNITEQKNKNIFLNNKLSKTQDSPKEKTAALQYLEQKTDAKHDKEIGNTKEEIKNSESNNISQFLLNKIYIPSKLFGKNIFPRNYSVTLFFDYNNFTIQLLNFEIDKKEKKLEYVDDILKKSLQNALNNMNTEEIKSWMTKTFAESSKNREINVFLTFKEYQEL